MKFFKIFVKYFFYPRMIILDPKYNSLCFILFLASFYYTPEQYSGWYVLFLTPYLIIGQCLPMSWLKEFYSMNRRIQ